MGHRVVQVGYRKYDGTAHRGYPSLLLGEDEHGSWLGVSRARFPTAEFKYEDPYVLLVPPHAWWTAMFNAPPRRTEIYCDITTPAHWPDPDRVELVDLDLDVRRRRASGLVELLDEDEFAEHRRRFGYPAEVVEQAEAAARWLVGALSAAREPFGGRYHQWLNQMR